MWEYGRGGGLGSTHFFVSLSYHHLYYHLIFFHVLFWHGMNQWPHIISELSREGGWKGDE